MWGGEVWSLKVVVWSSLWVAKLVGSPHVVGRVLHVIGVERMCDRCSLLGKHLLGVGRRGWRNIGSVVVDCWGGVDNRVAKSSIGVV